MKYYRINNPINTFGQYDYKGVNLDLVIPGSQEYSAVGTIVLLATNEDGLSHPDLIELTETDYQTQRANIQTENRTANPPLEDRTKELESQNAQMLLALVNGGLM